MFNKLKQFKEMRSQAKTLQNTLAEEKVEASAAWGKIKMTMNGNQEVQAVQIDPELLGNKEKLENAVKEVTNEAVKKVQKIMAEKVRSGGFKMPQL